MSDLSPYFDRFFATRYRMSEIQVPALAALSHVPPLTNPLVIADLHLDVKRPKTIMAFLRFMKNVARRYAELVILGDLFDNWVGDDENRADDMVAAELKLHTSTGRRVLLMRGESDILLGKRFADACGAELIEDPIVIEVAGRPILFGHGHLWCTGNPALDAQRAKMMSPDWQREVLRHPPEERLTIIENLNHTCLKNCELAGQDVTSFTEKISERAVADAARQAAVELVIHGHTHHPGAHINAVIERWVCPNWDLDDPEEGTARSGYISFRADGRPQIQLL